MLITETAELFDHWYKYHADWIEFFLHFQNVFRRTLQPFSLANLTY